MEYKRSYQAPGGALTLVSDGEHLTGLWFEGREYGGAVSEKGDNAEAWEGEVLPVFRETQKWLDIYFSGREPDFMPPLLLSGTPFRMAVWEILKTIPYGKTMTYGEIARILAEQRGIRRMSAQAVGGAVGSNPVGIVVPCHRVVGTGGNLTGFGGGMGWKVRLLSLEGVDMTKYFIPKTGRVS